MKGSLRLTQISTHLNISYIYIALGDIDAQLVARANLIDVVATFTVLSLAHSVYVAK